MLIEVANAVTGPDQSGRYSLKRVIAREFSWLQRTGIRRVCACPVSCFSGLVAAKLVERSSGRRARRYGVSWPVRIQRLNEGEWHSGRTVNLGVTGALIRTYCRLHVGESLEVQIEFLAHAERRTVVSSIAHVVREDLSVPGGAAIHFLSTQSDFAGFQDT